MQNQEVVLSVVNGRHIVKITIDNITTIMEFTTLDEAIAFSINL